VKRLFRGADGDNAENRAVKRLFRGADEGLAASVLEITVGSMSGRGAGEWTALAQMLVLEVPWGPSVRGGNAPSVGSWWPLSVGLNLLLELGEVLSTASTDAPVMDAAPVGGLLEGPLEVDSAGRVSLKTSTVRMPPAVALRWVRSSGTGMSSTAHRISATQRMASCV
jgi:hypothetical protein